MPNGNVAFTIDFGLSDKIIEYFLFFSVTAFLGWVLESCYRSFVTKQWINAGFLHGPFVPIYGFATTFILFIDQSWPQTWPSTARWVIFFIMPSVFEYFVGWLLEKTVKTKLWDYEENFLNINGRVCLKYSLAWAVLIFLDVSFLQPAIFTVIAGISFRSRYLLAGALLSYLAVDTWQSIAVYADFKRMLQTLKEAVGKGVALKVISPFQNAKLPLEWRRFLRPFRAFPELKHPMEPLSKVLPEEILERLQKIRGSAKQRIHKLKRK